MQLLAVIAVVVVLGYLLNRLWPVLVPVVLALLLSTVLWPVTGFLRRHSWPPALAALTVVVLFLAALAGVALLVVPPLVQQSGAVVDGVVGGLQQVQQWLTGPPLDLEADQVGQAVDRAITTLQDHLQDVAGVVLSALTSVGSGVVNAVVALVITFFFLKDGPRWLPWLGAQTTWRAAPHVAAVSRKSWRTLSDFIRSQALIGFVDAFFIGIGLFFLDVPLILPLTVLIFLGAFVPIVGAFVAGGVAVLIALVSNGFGTAVAVLGVILVVQAIEGNVLQPFIQGRGLGVHPAVIILVVSAGGTFGGILGSFLAVPIAALVAVLYRYARDLLDGRDPTTEEDSDTAEDGGAAGEGEDAAAR
ncbi:AI-2E family transporter [Geodermatophilus sp. TF02-6]|uniref:AI-2E family transporter n=1 Tax=Geodermatophilus sp. TF02-6 TaxID=2250575 RepID=UPI001F31677E|nr:AI-2E family transporter [Geodermatophilus sp. TF02-6]